MRKLTVILERLPDTATAEDLPRFQLHLVGQGTSAITFNATITGLKFFFDVSVAPLPSEGPHSAIARPPDDHFTHPSHKPHILPAAFKGTSHNPTILSVASLQRRKTFRRL